MAENPYGGEKTEPATPRRRQPSRPWSRWERTVPCIISSTWPCLWEAFEVFGLPDSILSDNDMIFAGRNGPSWIESRLMRLDIDVIHGRPYHPQTQGKVERLNGTLERELLRDSTFEDSGDLQRGFDDFRQRYNFERPHEALGLDVPGAHYAPSKRKRPRAVPEISYHPGALLRKVDSTGRISFKNFKVEVGQGISGEYVEIRDGQDCLDVFYGSYRVLGFNLGEDRVRRFRQYRKVPGGR